MHVRNALFDVEGRSLRTELLVQRPLSDQLLGSSNTIAYQREAKLSLDVLKVTVVSESVGQQVIVSAWLI